jgi:hypothetical protein
MTEPAAHPAGRARAVYRRLRAEAGQAAGTSALPDLEARVAELDAEIAESRALEAPLEAALARVEASLVPLLEAHEARRARRAAPDGPVVR